MAKKKNTNPIVGYFVPFGVKQACDIGMFVGVLVIFIGFFINTVTIQVGLFIYLAAIIAATALNVKVLLSGINKRSPEYKRALVNAVITGAILIMTAIVIIYSFVGI